MKITTKLFAVLFTAALLIALLTTVAFASMASDPPVDGGVIGTDTQMPVIPGHGTVSNQPTDNAGETGGGGGVISLDRLLKGDRDIKGDTDIDKPELIGDIPGGDTAPAAEPAAPGTSVPADAAVLSLADGCIFLYPDGYRVIGVENAAQYENDFDSFPLIGHTGSYVITGSRTDDTPLRIVNRTGDAHVFDLIFDNAEIVASKWCAAAALIGDSDITVNVVNRGSSSVIGHNHPAFTCGIEDGASPALKVNVFNSEASSVTLGHMYYLCAQSLYLEPIELRVNGEIPDNHAMKLTFTEPYADLQQEADRAAAEEVVRLIDAIGAVEYTEECAGRIAAARDAFDRLTDGQKALVSNAQTLEDAAARYNELKTTTSDGPSDGSHGASCFEKLISLFHAVLRYLRSLFGME